MPKRGKERKKKRVNELCIVACLVALRNAVDMKERESEANVLLGMLMCYRTVLGLFVSKRICSFVVISYKLFKKDRA